MECQSILVEHPFEPHGLLVGVVLCCVVERVHVSFSDDRRPAKDAVWSLLPTAAVYRPVCAAVGRSLFLVFYFPSYSCRFSGVSGSLLLLALGTAVHAVYVASELPVNYSTASWYVIGFLEGRQQEIHVISYMRDAAVS